MKRADVDSLAAGFTSVCASIIGIVAAPYFDSASIAMKVMAVIIGAPSLFAIFQVVHVLANRFRIREISGEWFYVTYPFLEDAGHIITPREKAFPRERCGYGAMRFSLNKNGEIIYHVDLFDELPQVVANVKMRQIESLSSGVATSLAIEFDDESRTISILYHARYHDPGRPDRFGRLFLAIQRGGQIAGQWASDVNRRELSAGRIFCARADTFKAMHENIFEPRTRH